MAKKKKVKTNALRRLEQQKIDYTLQLYDVTDGQVDGVSVAEKTGEPMDDVYKTLVTMSGEERFVCLIPVAAHLDLKKVASIMGVKKVDMLPLSQLTEETGYVRGGCSPVGMKKQWPTLIDRSAEEKERMIVSAGKVGYQMVVAPLDLVRVTDATFHPLTK